MPRATYMVGDAGEVHVHGDNWFKSSKKPCRPKHSWVGFTVFTAKETDIKALASDKNRGQGEIFEHEIKPEEWPRWRASDKREWDKVVQTSAVRSECCRWRSLAASGMTPRRVDVFYHLLW